MASLNATMTRTALADVDVELTVAWLAWNLHLKWLGDVGFVEESATVGTAFRQLCLVNLVDLFGGGWLTVSFGAVILARLAAGFLGIGFGIALGKGSGLALAGTKGHVELAA
jgi:hypothetical protein